MITLHRLGHPDEELRVNHDMIVLVEANPDTVITLQTGAKIVVAESPGQVARAVGERRVGVLSEAMRRSQAVPRAGAAAISGEPLRSGRDPLRAVGERFRAAGPRTGEAFAERFVR